MTEAYYFRQLDKAGQAAYHAMKTGLAALRPAFPVPRLEGRELGDVLARLRLDCPELFYVTGFSYRVHPAAATVELLPQYLFDKGKIQTHQKALAARLDRLCRPAMGLNEGEKERYVHDFICRNVRYDKLKKPYSHEILGPLGQGVGVCEGIAKAVKCLCDRLGVWCIVALAENNPDKGIKYRHAWNVVRLGDAYYHLDATTFQAWRYLIPLSGLFSARATMHHTPSRSHRHLTALAMPSHTPTPWPREIGRAHV